MTKTGATCTVSARFSLRRPLNGELAGIRPFRNAVNFLKDDLTNRHALFEPNLEWTNVPDFQTNLRSGKIRRVYSLAKSWMNGRRRHVNAEANASQAALSLHAGADARSIWQADFLDGPPKHERFRLDHKAFAVAGLRSSIFLNQ